MRVNRQRQATRVLLVLAVVLGSLWTGGLAATAASNPAHHLTASRSQPGIEPAALPDRVPALRAPVERPDPRGRVVPLLGALAAALVVASLWRAEGAGPGLTRVRSLVRSTPLAARAPPFLQSA